MKYSGACGKLIREKRWSPKSRVRLPLKSCSARAHNFLALRPNYFPSVFVMKSGPFLQYSKPNHYKCLLKSPNLPFKLEKNALTISNTSNPSNK